MLYRITRHTALTSAHRPRLIESTHTTTILTRRVLEKVVDTPKAARTTASYALEWATGGKFDFHKRQVKEHAARLNRIGIDIRQPFDVTRNSLVFVREAREVVKTFDLIAPSWYRKPVGHLQLVAA